MGRSHAWSGEYSDSTRSEIGKIGAAQVRGCIVRIIEVIRVDGRLVWHDENVDHGAELCRHWGDIRVSYEDVLVFLFHDLVARRHNHLDHVLASGQYICDMGNKRVAGSRVGVGHASRSSRSGGCGKGPGLAIRARELVLAIVRGRLDLIPVVKTVIALVLIGR